MSDESPDSIEQPETAGFAVCPRMADNVVIIDVRKDGALFGVISCPVLLGVSGFYTGMHAAKGDLADMIAQAYAAGQTAALQTLRDRGYRITTNQKAEEIPDAL